MSPDQVTLLQNLGPSLLLKGSFTIVLILTELFLLVLHKQIRAMNKIVTQPDMFPYLEFFTVMLEIAGLVLILLSLVLL